MMHDSDEPVFSFGKGVIILNTSEEPPVNPPEPPGEEPKG